VNPQLEPEHVAVELVGLLQAMPQPEQFDGSVVVSTQRPRQFVWSAAHDDVQPPFEHTCPSPHALPQPPQFWGSESTSMQSEPHWTKPELQVNAQPPPEQTALPFAGTVQTVPQVPQFCGSVSVFVHELWHLV